MGLGAFAVEFRPPVSEDFLLILMCLSFPSSLLFFSFVDPFIHFDPALDYALLALGMIAIGYVQWFIMVPNWFAGIKLTSLSLSSTKHVAVEQAPSVPISITVGADRDLQPTRPQPFPAQQVRVIPFDSEGCTPLERVIHDH
jgi:hypothetical protein